MNKLLVIGTILTILVATTIYFYNLKEEQENPITQEFQEKIPLYYNLDNPNQALVLEDGDYKEVSINGNSWINKSK